jgi:hypothetical protein
MSAPTAIIPAASKRTPKPRHPQAYGARNDSSRRGTRYGAISADLAEHGYTLADVLAGRTEN